MAEHTPKVFISATSADLRTVRGLVRDALLNIGCLPVVQEHFPPDYRNVSAMLRDKIAGCDALIHIAGMRYGAEPDPSTLPKGTPRRSYTQMEVDLARELGLEKVFTFVCPGDFPYENTDGVGDPLKPEAIELQQLQTSHRERLLAQQELRYRVNSPEELSNQVRELQLELAEVKGELVKTRGKMLRVGTAISVALALVAGGLWWVAKESGETSESVADAAETSEIQSAQQSLSEAVKTRNQSDYGQKEALELLNSKGRSFNRQLFNGVSFDSANIPGILLESAKLRVSTLNDAILTEANLREADARLVSLRGAKVDNADMTLFDGRFASARGADFSGSVLLGADLFGADLSGANFKGADLRGARLEFADLRGADLSGADLTHAVLNGALISKADFRGAVIDNTAVLGAVAKDDPFTESQKSGLRRMGVVGQDGLAMVELYVSENFEDRLGGKRFFGESLVFAGFGDVSLPPYSYVEEIEGIEIADRGEWERLEVSRYPGFGLSELTLSDLSDVVRDRIKEFIALHQREHFQKKYIVVGDSKISSSWMKEMEAIRDSAAWPDECELSFFVVELLKLRAVSKLSGENKGLGGLKSTHQSAFSEYGKGMAARLHPFFHDREPSFPLFFPDGVPPHLLPVESDALFYEWVSALLEGELPETFVVPALLEKKYLDPFREKDARMHIFDMLSNAGILGDVEVRDPHQYKLDDVGIDPFRAIEIAEMLFLLPEERDRYYADLPNDVLGRLPEKVSIELHLAFGEPRMVKHEEWYESIPTIDIVPKSATLFSDSGDEIWSGPILSGARDTMESESGFSLFHRFRGLGNDLGVEPHAELIDTGSEFVGVSRRDEEEENESVFMINKDTGVFQWVGDLYEGVDEARLIGRNEKKVFGAIGYPSSSTDKRWFAIQPDQAELEIFDLPDHGPEVGSVAGVIQGDRIFGISRGRVSWIDLESGKRGMESIMPSFRSNPYDIEKQALIGSLKDYFVTVFGSSIRSYGWNSEGLFQVSREVHLPESEDLNRFHWELSEVGGMATVVGKSKRLLSVAKGVFELVYVELRDGVVDDLGSYLVKFPDQNEASVLDTFCVGADRSVYLQAADSDRERSYLFRFHPDDELRILSELPSAGRWVSMSVCEKGVISGIYQYRDSRNRRTDAIVQYRVTQQER